MLIFSIIVTLIVAGLGFWAYKNKAKFIAELKADVASVILQVETELARGDAASKEKISGAVSYLKAKL